MPPDDVAPPDEAVTGADAPRQLGPVRLIVAGVATALMAAIGHVAEILAALGLYPSCVDTPPPGPPSFLLASAIIVLLCGGVPVLFVGLHRRGRARSRCSGRCFCI